MALTLKLLPTPAFAQQKCETLFSSQNEEIVLKQLAQFRVDAEDTSNRAMAKSLMALYNKKLRDAQNINLDVARLPEYIARLREQRMEEVTEEAAKIERVRETEDIFTWRQVKEVTYEEDLDNVSLTPDGKKFIKASKDGITVFDVHSGKRLNHFGITDGLAIKRSIAISPDSQLVAYNSPNKISVIDINTGKIVRNINRPVNINKMIFSRDGKKLIGARGFLGENNQVKIWSVDRSLGQKLLLRGNDPIMEFNSKLRSIDHMELNVAGTQLLMSGFGGTTLWDIQQNREVHHIPDAYHRSYFDSQDENLLVIHNGLESNNRHEIYDLKSQTILYSHPTEAFHGNNTIFIDNGTQFVTTTKFQTHVINFGITSNGFVTSKIPVPSTRRLGIEYLFVTPGDQYIIAIADNNKAVFWSRTSKEPK